MKLSERGRKVFRLRDGRLFASSGRVEEGLMLLDALRNGEPTPKCPGVRALLVHPNGRLEGYEGKRWSRIVGAEYAALGSGSPYALGAMAVGASAIQAVRAGIRHGALSGGRVQYVSLKKKRKSRR
jgi:hypothetical protein